MLRNSWVAFSTKSNGGLSTLAAALMIQQLTAIYFSTDAVPFSAKR